MVQEWFSVQSGTDHFPNPATLVSLDRRVASIDYDLPLFQFQVWVSETTATPQLVNG
jgi:hypothetical protein